MANQTPHVVRPTPACDLSPLATHGYCLWSRSLADDGLAELAAAIRVLAAEVAPPVWRAAPPLVLGPHTQVTSAGLVLTGLLERLPAHRQALIPAALCRAVQDLLGHDALVEVVGAMVSTNARPFFGWHTHLDGRDEGERVQTGVWPTPQGLRRVLTLLYLDDVDDDGGPLLVLPRQLDDPTRPPGLLDTPDWPGHVRLQPRAGTLVAIDERTWHAVLPMRRPGSRTVLAVYFAARGVPAGQWADPSLAGLKLLADREST